MKKKYTIKIFLEIPSFEAYFLCDCRNKTFSFQGDVIVSFDGVHVGCEGTVPFRSSERIAFRYLISQK